MKHSSITMNQNVFGLCLINVLMILHHTRSILGAIDPHHSQLREHFGTTSSLLPKSIINSSQNTKRISQPLEFQDLHHLIVRKNRPLELRNDWFDYSSMAQHQSYPMSRSSLVSDWLLSLLLLLSIPLFTMLLMIPSGLRSLYYLLQIADALGLIRVPRP